MDCAGNIVIASPRQDFYRQMAQALTAREDIKGYSLQALTSSFELISYLCSNPEALSNSGRGVVALVLDCPLPIFRESELARNGAELVRSVRKTHRNIPVAVFSPEQRVLEKKDLSLYLHKGNEIPESELMQRASVFISIMDIIRRCNP